MIRPKICRACDNAQEQNNVAGRHLTMIVQAYVNAFYGCSQGGDMNDMVEAVYICDILLQKNLCFGIVRETNVYQ